MEDRAQKRAALVPSVARLMRSRDFRNAMTVDPSVSQTVVIALPDDPMSYVFGHIRELGADGVLVMVKDDELTCATFTPASNARIAVAKEDDALQPVGPSAPVEMFLEHLAQVGTCVTQEVAVKILRDSGDPIPA